MSHFSVLVVGEDVAKQLQPFHEYECTGIDDEFVVDVDITQEAIDEYFKATVTVLKSPTGELELPFDAAGNYKVEFSKPGQHGRRELDVPEGWVELEQPAHCWEGPAEWIAEYYGKDVIREGEPSGKYGGVFTNEAGDVVRVTKRTNPNKRWDWWEVGGRWSGHLMLKRGARGKSGKPGLMGCKSDNAGVDVARKCDVDFDGMRDAESKRAAVRYDRFHRIVDGRQFMSWEECRGKYAEINSARDVYHSQAVVRDLAKDPEFAFGDTSSYLVTRDEFLAAAADRALSTFAYVRDSQWHERGRMGWFATARNEREQADWNAEFRAMLESLPDDTLLTVVDCHI